MEANAIIFGGDEGSRTPVQNKNASKFLHVYPFRGFNFKVLKRNITIKRALKIRL